VAHYIRTLIAQGEHQHLDFKFAIGNARRIAKSFVAFANASGGKLLIGVKDNGVIAGVRTEEELYMAEAAASYYCSPPVAYSFRKWECDGKMVLEVDIPEGTQKPYYAKLKDKVSAAYIRIADEDIKVCSVQLMVWKRQQNPSGLYMVDAEDKSLLLTYLRKYYPRVSIVMASKLLMKSYKKTVQLLADLVYLDILEIEYQNGEALFRMKKKFFEKNQKKYIFADT